MIGVVAVLCVVLLIVLAALRQSTRRESQLRGDLVASQAIAQERWDRIIMFDVLLKKSNAKVVELIRTREQDTAEYEETPVPNDKFRAKPPS